MIYYCMYTYLLKANSYVILSLECLWVAGHVLPLTLSQLSHRWLPPAAAGAAPSPQLLQVLRMVRFEGVEALAFICTPFKVFGDMGHLQKKTKERSRCPALVGRKPPRLEGMCLQAKGCSTSLVSLVYY